MPTIDISDEELQGFVHLCATASGPGVSWMLTNALLTKARLAQEGAVRTTDLGPLGGEVKLNSQEKGHAAIPRAT